MFLCVTGTVSSTSLTTSSPTRCRTRRLPLRRKLTPFLAAPLPLTHHPLTQISLLQCLGLPVDGSHCHCHPDWPGRCCSRRDWHRRCCHRWRHVRRWQGRRLGRRWRPRSGCRPPRRRLNESSMNLSCLRPIHPFTQKPETLVPLPFSLTYAETIVQTPLFAPYPRSFL
jgi:hypothetical protein